MESLVGNSLNAVVNISSLHSSINKIDTELVDHKLRIMLYATIDLWGNGEYNSYQPTG